MLYLELKVRQWKIVLICIHFSFKSIICPHYICCYPFLFIDSNWFQWKNHLQL